MTAQISDEFNYQGGSYSIVGINGTNLFAPTRYGLTPVGRCSSCWRGFVCTYYIESQQLLLHKLAICLDGPAPTLLGIQSKSDSSPFPKFDAIYEDLQHQINYAGGLLLGDDFIEELYVHMGFHPAWKFREVHELIFNNGELIQAIDCSEKIAELRRKMIEKPLGPGEKVSGKAIKRWIKQCFSQEYKW
jgi:hypothetical protein